MIEPEDSHDISTPEPWSGEHKIPWHEPEFSERMLVAHLDQSHDRASRSLGLVDHQVAIVRQWLPNSATILDLGCGPGFYCSKLSALGHRCTGIDFSPASIRHAQSIDHLSHYILGDVLTAEFPRNLDLAMMLYSEFQTFAPLEGRALLEKVFAALAPCGKVVLEVQSYQATKMSGQASPAQREMQAGLFSAAPHIWREQHFWIEEAGAAVTRHDVVDAAGEVTSYQNTLQAYEDHALVEMLNSVGFSGCAFLPSLPDSTEYQFLIATRRG